MNLASEIQAAFSIWYQARTGKPSKGNVTVIDLSLPSPVNDEGEDNADIVPSYIVNIRHIFRNNESIKERERMRADAYDLALQIYLHKGVFVYPKVETDD